MTKTQIMSVGEVARFIGRSERTVRMLADTGRLPAIRTGFGTRVFDRAVGLTYLSERDQGAR